MAKIKKLNDKGELIYPATILEAVKDPSTKENLREIINKGTTEYNVSVQHPTGGIGGTNKYTLETAIQKIPVAYRNVGIKCSFLNESGVMETWEYIDRNYSNSASWKKILLEDGVTDLVMRVRLLVGCLDWKQGGFIESGNGTIDIQTDNFYYTENYYPVKAGETLYLNVFCNGTSDCVAFYDKNKIFKKAYFITDESSKKIEIPSDGFLRFSNNYNYEPIPYVRVGNNVPLDELVILINNLKQVERCNFNTLVNNIALIYNLFSFQYRLNWTKNKILDERGDIWDLSGAIVTEDYNLVYPGQKLFLNGLNGAGVAYCIAFYDQEYTKISVLKGSYSKYEMTVPENANFARFGCEHPSSTIENIYVKNIVDNDIINEMGSLQKELDSIKDNEISLTWTDGVYIDSDSRGGTGISDHMQATLDYNPVKAGMVLQCMLKCQTNEIVAIYDKNKEYIKGINGSNFEVKIEQDGYIRFTNNKNLYSDTPRVFLKQLSLKSINDKIDKESLAIKQDIKYISDCISVLFDMSDIVIGCLNATTGLIFTPTQDCRVCKTYFSVNPGDTLISISNGIGSAAAICYYDASKKFIGSVRRYSISKDYFKDVVPEGCFYVRFSAEYYKYTGINAYKKAKTPQPELKNISKITNALNLFEKPYFIKDYDLSITEDDSSKRNFTPSMPKINLSYKGELNNEKKYIALGFDDFRESDFSLIIPLLDKYGVRAEFNCVLNTSNPTNTLKQRIFNLLYGGHELGDHTFYHYKFPFDEPMFNGQDPSKLDGSQVPFPTNRELRDDRGDGKNVFGKDITMPVSKTMSYQGPNIDTTWKDLSDSECQKIRNWYSLMKDTDTNLIELLDSLSNKFLGTTGKSDGSWDNAKGCYTGGLFTGCKTSANHEVWERIMSITYIYYKSIGVNYDLKTWSLPGSKSSGCYYENNGKYYYDSAHTILVNNLARFSSSLYKDTDGSAKNRSWTDVLGEFGYTTTHDALYPSRQDGQSSCAMSMQLIYNSKNKRPDALIYPTNRSISYSTIATECPQSFFTGTESKEVQMYDKNTSFKSAIEAWRKYTSNGVIWGEVIDSVDSFSERVILEGLLKYCKAVGIEIITKQEAYDICFNHKLEHGNLIYNPRLRNTAKEFLPTATTVPNNPDGYIGNCYVVKSSSGEPILVTTGVSTYNHYGIPEGNIEYRAYVKGSGIVKFYEIKNSSYSGLTDLNLIGTLNINSVDNFEEKYIRFYIKDADITEYEQKCAGYGEKIIGIKIEYSSGLEIKNISLTKK